MSHYSVCLRPSENDAACGEWEPTAAPNADPRHDAVHPSLPTVTETHESASDRSSSLSRETSRRSKVYSDLLKKWKEARFAAMPKPRSTHPRQAPSLHLRRYSSSSVDPSELESSWGNLSDTISAAAQSAWKEQLLRRKLYRLEGIPTNVILRQRTQRAEGYRVVVAAPNVTAEGTARMVVEGACPAFHALDSGRANPPQPPATGNAERVYRHLGGRERDSAFPHGNSADDWSAQGRHSTDECAQVPRLKARGERGGADQHAAGQRPSLPLAVPRRGFHLVDLHAVVRNSVEWSNFLPKVEPCFRVCDNRDVVLLGLVHALGARLTCSSAKDLGVAMEAARRERAFPSPPPRTLDRHVCRPPALLRAAAAAGVQLYEVDCAEEIRQIAGQVVRPAEILVRLAMPFQPKRKGFDCLEIPSDSSSTTPVLAGTLEAVYGAAIENVAGIVRAAAETQYLKSNRDCERASNVVGFSIDVGTDCWNDAIAAASLASGRDPSISPAGVSVDEAVASAALTRNIDAAVAFAVEAASRVAEEVSILREFALGPCGESTGIDSSRAGRSESASTPPPPPFSFQRLHVTGLGEGGSRGEPLTALKSSLSRHLHATGRGNDKPILVSADATEYLMASGVWSTVAAVIGRKYVAPTEASRSTGDGKALSLASGAIGCSPGKTEATGAMYYIDDGCYGSLSGALLRGVQMRPSPIIKTHHDCGVLLSSPATAEIDYDGAEGCGTGVVGLAGAGDEPGTVSCTVWGPTCDGIDCVSRITPLPVDMEPGRDWLFFADAGVRGSADTTGFNGLRPLDCFYVIRK